MTSPCQQRSNGWRSNQLPESARSIQRNGREYLRFPLVPLREMVLDYPEHGTREYLPANSIRSTVGAWDGTPLVFRHPENAHRTVNDPDAYTGTVIGVFHDPEFVDGEALRGNALIDVAKAEDIGGLASDVVRLLRAGRELSVSAGYATVEDTRENGTHEGEQYDLVQGPLMPDHIAIFPSDEFTARCSPEDGCAAPKARAKAVNATSEGGFSSDVFVSLTERNRAVSTVATAYGVSVTSVENALDDEGILLTAREQGYRGPDCSHVEPICGHVIERLADEREETTETMTTNTFESDAERQRAMQAISDANGMQVDRSTFPSDEVLLTVARASGYQNAESYPAGGREAWEDRQNTESDASTDAPGGRTSGGTHEGAVATRESYEQRRADGGARASPGEYVSESDRQQARARARRYEASGNRAMAERVREEYGVE